MLTILRSSINMMGGEDFIWPLNDQENIHFDNGKALKLMRQMATDMIWIC
jgi:hypothetical protein